MVDSRQVSNPGWHDGWQELELSVPRTVDHALCVFPAISQPLLIMLRHWVMQVCLGAHLCRHGHRCHQYTEHQVRDKEAESHLPCLLLHSHDAVMHFATGTRAASACSSV